MSEFTARLNIENFKAQLLVSTDEVQKATLRKLFKGKAVPQRHNGPVNVGLFALRSLNVLCGWLPHCKG